MMNVQNVGGMHTPVVQKIALSLANNQHVQFLATDSVNITNSILTGGLYSLHSPLNFKISDLIGTSINQPYRAIAVVDYRARVERVNKEFEGITEKVDNYNLSFPVEMSPV